MMLFDRIYLEISNSCNLKCSFCPTSEQLKRTLSLHDFSRAIKEIKPYTKEVALHLLGEPLSHPEFDDIIQMAAAQVVPVNIVTNGLLLQGKKVVSLLHPTVRQVSFSLQSFLDNFPDRDVTPYLKRILDFTSRAETERPDLYINFRFWDLQGKTNHDSPHNLGLKKTLSQAFHFNWDDVHINVRQRKNWRIRGRVYLHFDSRFDWPDLDKPFLGTIGRCHGLTQHIGIHADGTVVPCCLDHRADIPLGNIFTESLTDILKSPRALDMVKGFKEKRLVENLCQRCSYIRRFS